MKDNIVKILEFLRDPTSIFSDRARSKIVSFKRFLVITTVVLVIFWFNVGSIAEFLISEESLKAELEEKLSEKFNREVTVNGSVKFKATPEPNVVIEDIKVSGHRKDIPALHIGYLKGQTSIASIVSGFYKMDVIEVNDISINAHSQLKNGDIFSFIKNGDFADAKITAKNIKIANYKTNIEDQDSEIVRNFSLPLIKFDPSPAEGDYVISGNVKNNLGETNYFHFNLEDGLFADTDYTGKIYSDKTDIRFAGNVDLSGNIKSKGKISGYVGGFTTRLVLALGGQNLFNHLKFNEKTTINGSYDYSNDTLKIKDLSAKGVVADYKISLVAKMKAQVDVDLDVEIQALRYNELFKTREEYLANKVVIEVEQDFQKRLENFFLFAVNDDINFNFNFKINKILFANGMSGGFIMNASMHQKNFKVNEFKLVLPGQVVLKLASKIKVNRKDKTMSGFLDVISYGKDYRILSRQINVGDERAGEPSFIKNFYIKSKAYIYDQKIHFREIVSKVNESKFAGQLLIDYSKDLSATSAITFAGLEVNDYLKDGVKEDAQSSIINDNIASKLDFIRSFDSFFSSLNVSLSSKNVTRSGVLLEDFSMFAKIKPGIMEIKDIFFYTKVTGDFRGSAKFDISEFQPKINLDLHFENFDFDYILHGEPVAENDVFTPSSEWSREPINLQRLTSILGRIDVSIDNFKLAHFDLVDFKTSLNMLGEKVVVDKSRFELFESKVGFEGRFTTEYPSFSVKFEASDLNLNQIMENTLGINNVSGQFNSSGVLSSTGYSYAELVSKLNGRINIVSNGFVVKGFDLSAYSLALSKIVRVEQVQIISDELLTNGITEFGYLGSAFLVSAGKIIFNNMSIQSPYTKNMTTSGVIDLVTRDMQINTDYTLTTADNYKVPLRSQSKGKMDSLDLQWEYQGAKKYWEDKFYSGRIY